MEIYLNSHRLLYLDEDVVTTPSGRNYEIMDDRIGAGGNGAVYSCLDSSGQEYAIKFLLSPTRRARARFRQEISIMQRITHPHIIHYIDAGVAEMRNRNNEIQSVDFVIMEKADKNLADLLKNQSELSYEVYAAQFRGLCGALAKLHQIATHRDIKPENILIRGETWVLSDFGLCKILDMDECEDLTRTNEKIGPAFWMSPEAIDHIYFGNDEIGTYSDVFQLCAVFAFALAKKYPGGILSERDLPDVAPPIRAVIISGLSHQFADRPHDGQALLRLFNSATIDA